MADSVIYSNDVSEYEYGNGGGGFYGVDITLQVTNTIISSNTGPSAALFCGDCTVELDNVTVSENSGYIPGA